MRSRMTRVISGLLPIFLAALTACKTPESETASTKGRYGLAEGASCGGGIAGGLRCQDGLVCVGGRGNIPGTCQRDNPGIAEGESCGGGIVGGLSCKAGLTCIGAHDNIPGTCQSSDNAGAPGYYLTCQDSDSKGAVKLLISPTAIPTYVQGVLMVDGRTVNMQCVDQSGKVQSARADQQAALWSCKELRNGEGLYSADVVRQGLSALQIATVYQDMAYPAKPKVVSTLGCRQGDMTGIRN